jgi:hypothetical protein
MYMQFGNRYKNKLNIIWVHYYFIIKTIINNYIYTVDNVFTEQALRLTNSINNILIYLILS